jgi:hypothetical protein
MAAGQTNEDSNNPPWPLELPYLQASPAFMTDYAYNTQHADANQPAHHRDGHPTLPSMQAGAAISTPHHQCADRIDVRPSANRMAVYPSMSVFSSVNNHDVPPWPPNVSPEDYACQYWTAPSSQSCALHHRWVPGDSVPHMFSRDPITPGTRHDLLLPDAHELRGNQLPSRAPDNSVLNCVDMPKDVPGARGPEACDPGSTGHDYLQPRPGPATPFYHLFLRDVHAASQDHQPSIRWDNSLGSNVGMLDENCNALEQEQCSTGATSNHMPRPEDRLPSMQWDNSLGNDVDILEEVQHALQQDHSPAVATLNGMPKHYYGYAIPGGQHHDLILPQQHALREHDLEPEMPAQDCCETSDEVADGQQQQVRATGKRRPDGWVSKTVQSALRTTIWPHTDLLVACRFDHEPDSSRALDLSPGCHFCRR